MSEPVQTLIRFLRELRRRNVYKVAITYLVAVFVVVQVADLAGGAFGLPPWFEPMIWVLCGLGFPIALVLAWAFELTPEGVRRASGREARAGPGTDGDIPIGGGRWVLASAGLLAAAAGGWYLIQAGEDPVPRAGERSIAVLPFEALGQDDAGPFTEGMHDDLLTRLSNVSGFKVISRTSVRQYRNSEKTARQIAAELGVKWILEGGVQEMGDQIQVNAQLIDPHTDTHAWAESYRRDLTPENLFAIQSEITERIVRSLEARLTPTEKRRVEREPTRSLEAYRFYVQGRTLLDQRTEESMQRALGLFRSALQQDSSYALAWSGLADATGLLEFLGAETGDSVPRPLDAARRALALDPDLAEAHASLGNALKDERDGAGALRALERAVELKPSYAQAFHWLGFRQLLLGRPGPALETALTAVELNPHVPSAHSLLAETHLANGEAAEALVRARRARTLEPGYGPVYAVEGAILQHLGRPADARAILREGLPLVPGGDGGEGWNASGIRALLAVTYVATGDTIRARSLMDRLEQDGADPYWTGLAHAAFGDVDAAFQAFARVAAWDDWPTFQIRYYFPDLLGRLRDDPRYNGLIGEVNASWGLNPDGSVPAEVAENTPDPMLDGDEGVWSSPRFGLTAHSLPTPARARARARSACTRARIAAQLPPSCRS